MTVRQQFVVAAVAFEGALGLLALALAWLCGTWPAGITALVAGPHLARDLACGVLVTLPLLAGVVSAYRCRLDIFQNLARIVREQVVPLFRGVGLLGLLAISLAAGVGEELLFRGFLQQAVTDLWRGDGGPWVGLAVAAILFGACHSLCVLYAVLAAAMGLLLGGLYLATGHLAAPIATHACYDFLALVYLLADDRAGAERPPTGADAIENGGSVGTTRAAVRLPD